MSINSIQQIEEAVRQLSVEELTAFRSWFIEYDNQLWDRKLEEDVAAGRLDRLADEAISDLQEGRCTDL